MHKIFWVSQRGCLSVIFVMRFYLLLRPTMDEHHSNNSSKESPPGMGQYPLQQQHPHMHTMQRHAPVYHQTQQQQPFHGGPGPVPGRGPGLEQHQQESGHHPLPPNSHGQMRMFPQGKDAYGGGPKCPVSDYHYGHSGHIADLDHDSAGFLGNPQQHHMQQQQQSQQQSHQFLSRHVSSDGLYDNPRGPPGYGNEGQKGYPISRSVSAGTNLRGSGDMMGGVNGRVAMGRSCDHPSQMISSLDGGHNRTLYPSVSGHPYPHHQPGGSSTGAGEYGIEVVPASRAPGGYQDGRAGPSPGGGIFPQHSISVGDDPYRISPVVYHPEQQQIHSYNSMEQAQLGVAKAPVMLENMGRMGPHTSDEFDVNGMRLPAAGHRGSVSLMGQPPMIPMHHTHHMLPAHLGRSRSLDTELAGEHIEDPGRHVGGSGAVILDQPRLLDSGPGGGGGTGEQITSVYAHLPPSQPSSGPSVMSSSACGSPSLQLAPPVAPRVVYNVKFKRTQRSFVTGPRCPREGLRVGCYVKVEADRGEDLGIVVSRVSAERFHVAVRFRPPQSGGSGCIASADSVPAPGPLAQIGQGATPAGVGAVDLKRIVRLATHDEVALLATKRDEEEELLKICRAKVRQRGLPMTVVDAEYQFDRHKLTFFFEAEGRIDFRELVRDLFSVYKTRIWMQQLDKSCSSETGAGSAGNLTLGAEGGSSISSSGAGSLANLEGSTICTSGTVGSCINLSELKEKDSGSKGNIGSKDYHGVESKEENEVLSYNGTPEEQTDQQ